MGDEFPEADPKYQEWEDQFVAFVKRCYCTHLLTVFVQILSNTIPAKEMLDEVSILKDETSILKDDDADEDNAMDEDGDEVGDGRVAEEERSDAESDHAPSTLLSSLSKGKHKSSTKHKLSTTSDDLDLNNNDTPPIESKPRPKKKKKANTSDGSAHLSSDNDVCGQEMDGVESVKALGDSVKENVLTQRAGLRSHRAGNRAEKRMLVPTEKGVCS